MSRSPSRQSAGVGFVAAHQERRQAQQARCPDAGARRGDGAAGLRRDEGEARRLAGDRAAGQIEAVAEIGEQHRLPADQVAQHRLALRQMGDQVQQAVEHARMRLTFRQGALPPRRTPPTASPAQAHRPWRAPPPGCTSSALKLPSCSASRATQRTCTRLPGCQIAVRPRAARRAPGRDARRAPSVITVAMASPSPYGRASSTMAGASQSMTRAG